MANRLALTLLLCSSFSLRVVAEDYCVFTSFRGNGEDGLHLALSTNGYHWQALNGDRSFLISKGFNVRTVGGNVASGYMQAQNLPLVANLPFVSKIRLSKQPGS